MYRNTIIFIAFLAVIAALLTGINIGRRLTTSAPPASLPAVTPAPVVIVPSPLASPTPAPVNYTLPDCGVSFVYDPQFTLQEASASAQLTQTSTGEKISVACAASIPKPPLPKEKVDDITVAAVKTKLYHDASAKDGTPVDVVVVRHPSRKLDVGFFGFGEKYNDLLKTVTFLP
jgi:hypothetical protein